jgi:hypothetical protein
MELQRRILCKDTIVLLKTKGICNYKLNVPDKIQKFFGFQAGTVVCRIHERNEKTQHLGEGKLKNKIVDEES